MIITLLVFILILGILVFVHELGHFLAAKRAGVRVEEFAFGFKPRIWGKKIGETIYGINAIPLGGYVKLYGEDKKEKGDRAFNNKSKPARASILVAGTLMNFILAWVIFSIIYGIGFEPIMPDMDKIAFARVVDPVKIVTVAKGSPAEAQGLKSGDMITAIEGNKTASSMDTILAISRYLDKPITISLERDHQTLTVPITPRKNPPKDQGAIGVTLSGGKIGTTWYKAPVVGFLVSGKLAGMSIGAFGSFIKNLFVKQEVSEDVTGIVGIGAITGMVRRLGFIYLIQFVALISTSLAVINLFPIVPFDGGHLMILGIEAVRKKKLKDIQVQWMGAIGLAFILLLFLVVTYHDVIRFGIWDLIKGVFK